MVRDIEQQRIVFNYSEDFYSKTDTPEEVLNQTPLILDPSNPYNNVMSTFSPLVQQFFRVCALLSLERLKAVEEQIKKSRKFPQFTEIFLPQLIPSLTWIQMRLPQRWVISKIPATGLLKPRLIVRDAALNIKARTQIAQFYKAFSAIVFISDIEANYKIAGTRKIPAGKRIRKSIDHLFGESIWIPCRDTHDDRDVTFTIPIGPFRLDYLIISFDWE